MGEHELKFWNEADEMPYKTGSCTRCPIPYRSHGETDENLNNDSPYHSDHNEVMFQVSPSQGLVVAFARTYYGVEELWRKKV